MIRIFLTTLLLGFAGCGGAQDLQPIKDAGPYVPSPQSVVSDMLRYADVGPDDFLIDLGSGDGRIVLTAAKVFGARGFGVEIKDDLVKNGRRIEAMRFGALDPLPAQVRAAYRLSVNEFNGLKNIQLNVEHFE